MAPFELASFSSSPRSTTSLNGTSTHIEPKVMQVLVCLAEHAGKVVPKEKLIRSVWADTFVTDDVNFR